MSLEISILDESSNWRPIKPMRYINTNVGYRPPDHRPLDWSLSHYSRNEIVDPYYMAQEDTTNWKPRGLWVTPDHADCNWPLWCRSEDFGFLGNTYRHRVHLHPDANVLVLFKEDFKAFHHFFGQERDPGRLFSGVYIRWDWVASYFDGILIPTYVWEYRLEGPYHGWYYTWDCASGCIWSPDAIIAIAPVRKELMP